MFETKIRQIESKVEELIDDKVAKKKDVINTPNVNDKDRNYATAITTLDERTY